MIGLPGGFHSSLMPELRAAATAKLVEGKGWEEMMENHPETKISLGEIFDV